MTHTKTHSFDDAVVTIEDERPFYGCEITVEKEIEEQYNLPVMKTYSGYIQFSEPIPDDVFFDGDGLPNNLSVDVESKAKTGEFENFLPASDTDDNKIEFLVSDAEIKKKRIETTKDTQEVAVELLDDLACEIVDGDAHVVSVDREREFGAGGGVSTLEVAYQ